MEALMKSVEQEAVGKECEGVGGNWRIVVNGVCEVETQGRRTRDVPYAFDAEKEQAMG